MEKQQHIASEVNQYLEKIENRDIKHQAATCFRLNILRKYIDQLINENMTVEKRELLMIAILDDYPEEVYNSMLLSTNLNTCKQIREEYLIKRYAERNPAFQKAEEQVKEFHDLLEEYKYRLKSNEEIAKAVSSSQAAVAKAYEEQIKNLQNTSTAIQEEKEKRLAEKDKTIEKLEEKNLQLEEEYKKERKELEDIISNLQEEKLQLIKENHQGTPVFSPQVSAGTIGAAESTVQKSEETTEKKKGFFGRKKAEPIGKINHTPEERSAMVEFIRTNGFDSTQNDFLIRCFKEKGVPFSRIQEIAAKHLTAEEMQELLNILTM